MVEELYDVLETLRQSDEFASFQQEHPSYYLAHGFLQLDASKQAKEPWQIGFYSPQEDKLAMFHTQPVRFEGFEDAFKQDACAITKLTYTKDSLKVHEALEKVSAVMSDQYADEKPTSYILIVQVINQTPVFNITVITQTFAMIPLRIDAIKGEILSHEKRSVLDLQKEQIKGDLSK